ncbi:intein-containing dynein heavy chain precursor [Anaeramoeba ignava]|uniref:Dynein heavy chain, cytoplasmic n=2 Tax=Anaeramoeba ignava TaxID=1746090 RepID=A0A9Q0RG72_ANAIG|nr:intein-containing dynein heavy chain precursor [Anaeramoeba ignava]
MADTQTIIETKILLEYVEKACQALFATFQSENREKGIKKLMEEKETEEKITKYAKESEINVLFIGCYPKETEEEEIFTLDLEVMYLGGKSTSIAFIKRFPIIKQDASLASQIHVMNIGEGSPFETIQNLMHYSVWPFFHSFDLKIREQSNQFIQNSKVKLQITQDAPAVKKKLAELELTLIQCQQNVEIPEVVLFIEPEITEIIQKAKENGTRVKLTDLGNSFDDPEFLTRVQNGVNKWITDIQKVTRMKRDVSSGTALQEINFWISLEKALKNIDKQVKTTETQLQLEFLNLKKKHFAGFAFESDTGLKKLLDTSENYNVLMKDFPLSEMLSAQDLDKIRESILRIFSHLRKLKNTNYPLQRALLFVESISRDFCLQVIRVLSSKNLLNLLFDEFDNLIAKSFDLFQTWEDQVTHLRDIIREIARRKGENKFSVRISTQIQPLKERLEQLRKFRKQHDQLQNVITRILPKTSTEFTEINAIEEVKEAYEYVRNVDPLSLSKEGNETWSESLKHYDTKIYSIEEQIIQILREKLEKAKKASEMFHVFSQFNVLFVRPKIRGAIQEYQTRLIERVKEDIQALHEKFKQQYIETETSKITEVRDIPPISGAIIWVKQIRNQLDTYIKRVGDVLGRSWENHIEGQKLKLDGENFKKKLNPQKIFDDWVRQVETRKWEVSDIITLFKEVRNLQWLGFRVPFSIMHIAKNAGQVYPFAVSLIESIKNYFHICQTVDTEIFPLIASYRSQIQDSLKQGCSIGWDYIDLDSYVTELGNSILIFEEQVDGLINRYHDIKLSLEELKNCEFQAPNFENILSKIQKNVDELKSGSFSNLDLWINSLNQKIEQIFLQRLTDCLNAWNITFDEFLEQIELEKNPKKEKKIIQKDPNILAIKLNLSKMTFSINIKNRIIYLDPSFKEARENWISQLHKTIGIICNQKRIIILTKEKKEKKSRTKKTRSFDETKTYFNLVTFLPKGLLLTAYQKIELLLSQVEEYTKLWFKNQALWDIEPERVYKEVGDDLDKLKNLLLEIQTERSGLDTHSSSKDIGPITVDYSQIQTKVTNKYSAWHKNFLNKFAERLNSSMKEFHQTVADARTELEKHSLDQDTTSDIITFVTQLTHMRRNLNEWESAVDLYRSGEEILQKQGYPFGQNWLSYETVDGVWSSFNEIFSRKNSQVNQEIPLLQHKIAEEDELLSTKLTSFNQDWEKDKPLDGKTKPSHAITKIAQFESRLNEIEEINNRIIKAKEALDMDVQDKNLFPPIREELVSLKQVWNELMSIWDKLEEIKKTPWSAIVPKKLRGSLDDLITQLRALPSKVRQYNAYEHFHSMIKGFLKCNVTIIDLKSESLKERHWKQIQNKLGVKWVFSELTLADIYNVDLIKNETIFKEVIRIAQGELALEKFLEQIKDHWQNYELELVNYRNKCKLIRGWDDLFTKISDHLNSLSAMKNSPFYKVFEEEAVGWEDKLNRVHLLFDTWIDVQRKWVYLEGVFCGSADIQQLLPQESSKFRNIDNDFLITMKKVVKSPHILDVLNLPGIQNSLERLSDMLSKIQKALGEYLEKQRSAFPRFYFVGDEDLLEIIGHSKDVLKIQRHLRKMFAGIALLKLSDDETSIIGMLSREHEEINFPDPIKYKEIPKIHEWLSLVENQMRVSLGNCLDISLREFIQLSSKDELDKDLFLKWVETTPAQIIVLTIQAIWTQKVENALSNKSETLLKKTLDWIGNILDLLAFNVLFDLQPITRSKYEHLIIELIHQRDVIRRLIQTNVRTLDNFSWIQEMRFYWNEKESHEKKLMISIANASFAYGFEYLGVVDKLVQTPLTDRCYLTLTQALNLRLGGAPAGPAGTGKSLRNSTIVYTPNGPKLNGDLQIGDEVCTPDGKFAKILAVYPQGKIGVFRVHFKDGGFVDCSDDHLWSVDHSSKIITTQEMRRCLRREEKISIETPKYTNFKTQKTKISPYLFGVLIAGNEKILENQNIKISNSINKQIFQNIQHLLNLTSDGNYEIYYDQINDYMPKLSQNKFIPNEFQFNSKEIRFQLLQGILDRNGYFDSKTNSPIYSTSSQQLAFDLKKLIESLGGICYISRTKQNEEIIFNCRIEIEKPEKLFTLNDKILIAKKSKKFINERFVSKIEYICKDECQCILIDHPDHLFITENHIVTHNTETVKALGNQLGRFVLVFNCDENFDFQAMGRIFVGLCQCGAWGCFDEFNRLEERMLSAVSQQIQTIQLSLKEQLKEVELIGRNVKINPNMGIFITMNPGYTGRVQLPENLKTLFRTISVVKPDRELIAQVMLFSQGFKTAEKLSGKVVPLFNLCADQLSQQTHYDFGLRALKSVLVSAGNIKRLEIKDKKQDEVKDRKQLGEEEKFVVIKSICETVIPKLVADDIPLLHSLLSDVFPGALPIELEMAELRNVIYDICKQHYLVPGKRWIEKMLQLFQLQKIHHGVMMVGPSGSGKSTAWKILLEALERVEGIKSQSHVIDPKAITKEELFGVLDPTTREWTDGIFTHILRKIVDNVRGELNMRHWIIFDGDVDSIWVENLNSVLDDNKILTLPNGERVALTPNVRVMFEVQDLRYATPATVSRCGMVWFSDDIISLDMNFAHYLEKTKHVPLLESEKTGFEEQLSDEKEKNEEVLRTQEICVDVLRKYFDSNGVVIKAIDYASKKQNVMDFTNLRSLTSAFSLLDQGINHIHEYNSAHVDFSMKKEHIQKYVTKRLLFSLIWGFGGSMSLQDREEFGTFLLNNCDIQGPKDKIHPLIDFEVQIDDGEWILWKNRVPNLEIETYMVASSDVVIPTVDTLRHEEVVNSWLKDHLPLILCGPPGSGKSLRNSATVYTPNGPKINGKLKIGDVVCTPDGKTSKIIGIYPQGKLHVYRVKFEDGDFVDCSADHLWTVNDHSNYKKQKFVLTTQQIIDNLQIIPTIPERKGARFSIDTPKPILFMERNVPFDPYLLGVLIGKEEIYIGNENIEKQNHYKEILEELGLLNQPKDKLFIPQDYIFNSKEIRLEIIKGLLDSNSSINYKDNSIIFKCKSTKLSQDFKKVIQSLGGMCSIETNSNKTNLCKIFYKTPKELFKLSKNKDKIGEPSPFVFERRIISIECVGEDECTCITIDHPEELYLTDNFVVTHNTMTLYSTLRSLPNFEVVGINFSSATTPELVMKTLTHYCKYQKTPNGVIIEPKSDKWLVIFCDEINLPKQDRYGTQKVITFLRQLVERGGFWRISDYQWVTTRRIQFVGACNPPTMVGRVPLSHRFLRHAPVILVDYPSADSLKQIYGTFNRAVLRLCPSFKGIFRSINRCNG